MSTVLESNFEDRSVIQTPKIIIPVNINVDKADCNGKAATPAKNMVIMAIKVGKRPLQGTKLLVRIAMSRSRGESMIRHPITPQALQPNPIHIVSDCFPWALAFLKNLSILNATRGRYPESSKRVKRGKKIAMAGLKKNHIF